MKYTVRQLLTRYRERFDRDHERRRWELLALLPDLPVKNPVVAPAEAMAAGARRRVFRLAAIAATVLPVRIQLCRRCFRM